MFTHIIHKYSVSEEVTGRLACGLGRDLLFLLIKCHLKGDQSVNRPRVVGFHGDLNPDDLSLRLPFSSTMFRHSQPNCDQLQLSSRHRRLPDDGHLPGREHGSYQLPEHRLSLVRPETNTAAFPRHDMYDSMSLTLFACVLEGTSTCGTTAGCLVQTCLKVTEAGRLSTPRPRRPARAPSAAAQLPSPLSATATSSSNTTRPLCSLRFVDQNSSSIYPVVPEKPFRTVLKGCFRIDSHINEDKREQSKNKTLNLTQKCNESKLNVLKVITDVCLRFPPG